MTGLDTVGDYDGDYGLPRTKLNASFTDARAINVTAPEFSDEDRAQLEELKRRFGAG